VLDAHLSAADRAGVQLFLDDDHERELLERKRRREHTGGHAAAGYRDVDQAAAAASVGA
jgi:hypothetical protein